MLGICFAVNTTRSSFDVGVPLCVSHFVNLAAAAAAATNIASTSWIGIAAPVLPLGNEVGGWNLEVFA
jgi:hypothetical protein